MRTWIFIFLDWEGGRWDRGSLDLEWQTQIWKWTEIATIIKTVVAGPDISEFKIITSMKDMGTFYWEWTHLKSIINKGGWILNSYNCFPISVCCGWVLNSLLVWRLIKLKGTTSFERAIWSGYNHSLNNSSNFNTKTRLHDS
jgi:hypothetical protein